MIHRGRRPSGWAGAADVYVMRPTDVPTVVGRGEDADLRIVGRPDVSGRHCRLKWITLAHFRVLDLGSANGTYVWRPGAQALFRWGTLS